MSDKKKSKKKGQETPVEVDQTPAKIEYTVATYLKKKAPTKRTKFLNHQVNYFSSNKAVDILLDSQWATGKDVIFTDRQSVVDFCDKLLRHKFFHRAKKIAITDKDLKPKELKKKKEKEKEEKKRKELEKKKEEEDQGKEDENDEENDKKEDDKTQDDEGDESKDPLEKEKKKKKAKIKLDMHLDQVFIDGSEAYVWMYDPIPFWYYIAGALCLFGAIAICLFPLWPPSVRKGVYYLSMGAAGFLAVILGLAVLRFIIFIIFWALSMGRHHFWMLPNLTEDVGFFASFWPLYQYEYRGNDYRKKKSKKKKKEDDERELEATQSVEKNSDVEETAQMDSEGCADTDKHETDGEKTCGELTAVSETDSENSNSQTFEMVNKEDVESDPCSVSSDKKEE